MHILIFHDLLVTMKSVNTASWNSVIIISLTSFNYEFQYFLHSQNKTGSGMASELTESFGGGDMERILGGYNNSVHSDE